jgi:hypothetical protein
MIDHSIYTRWLSSIDVPRIKIKSSPSLIFLCGGSVSGNSSGFTSCRDIFFNYIKNSKCSFKNKLILAERTFDYFKHSGYQDLLLFEKDLAELSNLIIIFSESPGSIAEFGSFAVMPKIRDKLLVVLHEDHAEKESFIWRGPALSLNRFAEEIGKKDPIAVYRWNKTSPSGDLLDYSDFKDAPNLEATIESLIAELPKSESFDIERLGHAMILIVELLRVVRIATADDIVNFLSELRLSHSKPSIKRYLSLLSSIDYIVKKRYGNNVFYHSITKNSWVTWAYKKGSLIRDTSRWMTEIINFYFKNDPHKHNALKSFMASRSVGP